MMLDTKTKIKPVLKNEDARKFLEKKRKNELAINSQQAQIYKKMIEKKFSELEEKYKNETKTN